MTTILSHLKFWPGIAGRIATLFVSGVADLVCPPNCLACSEPLDRNNLSHFYCGECCRRMTVDVSEYCPLCGAIGRLLPNTDGSRKAPSGCRECERQALKSSTVKSIWHKFRWKRMIETNGGIRYTVEILSSFKS